MIGRLNEGYSKQLIKLTYALETDKEGRIGKSEKEYSNNLN